MRGSLPAVMLWGVPARTAGPGRAGRLGGAGPAASRRAAHRAIPGTRLIRKTAKALTPILQAPLSPSADRRSSPQDHDDHLARRREEGWSSAETTGAVSAPPDWIPAPPQIKYYHQRFTATE